MTACKHYDCGWCYAPDYLKTSAIQGGCFEPEHCPNFCSSEPAQYETPMTKNEEEIEKVKAQIKVLQSKLSFLEELEKTKAPCEEAYKECYGMYPRGDVYWEYFKDGYNAASQDYKVGEYNVGEFGVRNVEANIIQYQDLRKMTIQDLANLIGTDDDS